MSDQLDIHELERRRQAKGALLTASLRGQKADDATDLTVRLEAALARQRERSAAFVAEWQRWFGGVPPAVCRRHADVRLLLDEAASHRASFDRGENVARYHRCPECVADAADMGLKVRLAKQGVPANLLDCRLENWTARGTGQEEDLEMVKRWAKRPVGGLVIIGEDVGVGKTHLAVGALAQHKAGGIFAEWNPLLKRVRGTYGQTGATDALLDRLCKTPLLVLDEVGLSTGGADEVPILHLLLNSRIGEMLPFILTGNFATREAMLPVLGPRLFDRFTGSIFHTCVIKGLSFRKSKRKEYLGIAERRLEL